MKPIGKPSCRLKIWLCVLILAISCPYAMAQVNNSTLSVSGVVTDENNEALIGVSVLLKGQPNIGTVTDLEGEYHLSGIPADAILQFSYVGMDPVAVKVGGRTKIDVVMKTSSAMLDEVVAIGYGSVKKSDLTGSVASVKPEAITNTPANSVENLLQGRAAGLSINTSSQDPGSG